MVTLSEKEVGKEDYDEKNDDNDDANQTPAGCWSLRPVDRHGDDDDDDDRI